MTDLQSKLPISVKDRARQINARTASAGVDGRGPGDFGTIHHHAPLAEAKLNEERESVHDHGQREPFVHGDVFCSAQSFEKKAFNLEEESPRGDDAKPNVPWDGEQARAAEAAGLVAEVEESQVPYGVRLVSGSDQRQICSSWEWPGPLPKIARTETSQADEQPLRIDRRRKAAAQLGRHGLFDEGAPGVGHQVSVFHTYVEPAPFVKEEAVKGDQEDGIRGGVSPEDKEKSSHHQSNPPSNGENADGKKLCTSSLYRVSCVIQVNAGDTHVSPKRRSVRKKNHHLRLVSDKQCPAPPEVSFLLQQPTPADNEDSYSASVAKFDPSPPLSEKGGSNGETILRRDGEFPDVTKKLPTNAASLDDILITLEKICEELGVDEEYRSDFLDEPLPNSNGNDCQTHQPGVFFPDVSSGDVISNRSSVIGGGLYQAKLIFISPTASTGDLRWPGDANDPATPPLTFQECRTMNSKSRKFQEKDTASKEKKAVFPNLHVTKLTKVQSPPSAPTSSTFSSAFTSFPATKSPSLPASPVAGRPAVKSKPILPAYLTLGRKGVQKKFVEDNGFEDSTDQKEEVRDTEEIEKIRSILAGLDLAKYKRKQTTPTKSLSNDFFGQSGPENSQHTLNNNKISAPPSAKKSKLKELTEKLKPITPTGQPSPTPSSKLSASSSKFSIPPPPSASLFVPQQKLKLTQPATAPSSPTGTLKTPAAPSSAPSSPKLWKGAMSSATGSVPGRTEQIHRTTSLNRVDLSTATSSGDSEKHLTASALRVGPLAKDRQKPNLLTIGSSATLPRRRQSPTSRDSSTASQTLAPLGLATRPPRLNISYSEFYSESAVDEGLGTDADAAHFSASPAQSSSSSRGNSPNLPIHARLKVAGVRKPDLPFLKGAVGPTDAKNELNSAADKRKRRKGQGGSVGIQITPPDHSKPGRSLTFPPQRRSSMSEDEVDLSSVDSNGFKSLKMSPSVGQESLRQPSDLSLADSHFCPSEAMGEETYQDVVESLSTRSFVNLEVEDRNEKMFKKKHHSDPGTDNSVDFPELIASCRSEPDLVEPDDDTTESNNRQQEKTKDSQIEKKIISSTRRQQIHVPSVTPMSERLRSRDSLSKDSLPAKQAPGSPQQHRRYFKKRLRGPYGEMLEEEMRKSGGKPKPSYAQELGFLQELCEQKSEDRTQEQVSREEITTSDSRTTRARPLLRSSSHSLDESHLQRSDLDVTTPRRKISANIPLGKESSENSLKTPAVTSTTSEPSLLPCERRPESGLCAPEEWSVEDEVPRLLSPAAQQDTRAHVIGELFDTESSYVESLQILVSKYMKPLKSPEYAGLIESNVVDEIFYQIPEILNNHEVFLEALRCRLGTWDSKQTVGDVFAEVFTKQSVIETYTAFIHNWKSAKEAIKSSTHSKPAFAKFLEHMSREHKGKLTLDALLIMPVQRIPRYELLIKELLKHTQMDHPDYNLLVQAQKEVHDLAVNINHVEREVVEQEQMLLKIKEIEHLIDGVGELLHPERTFLRHDLVTIPGGLGIKKDRCLFLFSDLLLITSIKRRSAAMRKSSSLTNSPSPFGSLETNKYKLLMRLPLENLEIIKTTTDDRSVRKILKEIETLEDDVAVLGKIAEMLPSLSCHHQVLEEALREVLGGVSKQLIDRQTSNTHLLNLEMAVTINEGVEDLIIIFPTPERRLTWETAFIEAKEKLALCSSRCYPPDFIYPLPIRKTRAGLQITCAAPTLGLNHYGLRDVWVCNSDGYVGQVCILSMQPEPTVTSCNGVSNARILCITSVPGIVGPSNNLIPRQTVVDDFSEMKSGHKIDMENIAQKSKNGSFQLDSESSEDDEDGVNIVDDEFKFRRSSLPREDESDNHQPTMWLGTEDGCIYVYNCNDNIRIKKTKIRIQHSAAIYCIIPVDSRVFVSLANGELLIYNRDLSGGWDTNNPERLLVGSISSPYTRMIVVTGKLWCGSLNSITTLNPSTLEVEHSFQVTADNTRPILNMVTTGMGVWVSLQNSAVIRLFHATTHESLLDVNITPPVTKMLSACDDIIRQHKSACLRVTALLACKDLLWVGTSAGVLLTLPLPHVTSTTSQVDTVPNVTGIAHGHTGHVRFLTSVEMTPTTVQDSPVHPRYSNRSLRSKEGFSKWQSSPNIAKLLVISGGDGYEDFSNMGLSEAAGRDDSTNHLLLWKV